MGMNFDDVLIAILLVGAGLSAAYVRAEYIRWRRSGAQQLRRESAQHDLHTARLSQHQTPTRAARALLLRKFRVGETASNDASSASRPSLQNHAQPSYVFFERRKHPRSGGSTSFS
jgi:hypothetical protein